MIKNQHLSIYFKRLLTAVSVVVFVVASFSSNVAFAAQITGRSVVIGSSAASATTSYNFSFTTPSSTTVQSVDFLACTTASGSCTTPSGFSASSSSLTSQPTGLGSASGWTVNTATAGDLKISNSSNATAPSGSQAVNFSGVVNPSATNSNFFLRITTYSDAAWTTAIDTGTVATSTAGQVTVTASVDEALTFTLASTTVPLGTLTTSTTGSGTSAMSVATNAGSGYSVTVSGTTLTSGSNTITALTSPTASSMNTKQFGLNLVANTTPAVGSAVTGTGIGTAATGYNTANQYKFVSGDTVASATGPTNTNTYTTSYIANIDGSTPPGSYSTVLTYVATPNF